MVFQQHIWLLEDPYYNIPAADQPAGVPSLVGHICRSFCHFNNNKANQTGRLQNSHLFGPWLPLLNPPVDPARRLGEFAPSYCEVTFQVRSDLRGHRGPCFRFTIPILALRKASFPWKKHRNPGSILFFLSNWGWLVLGKLMECLYHPQNSEFVFWKIDAWNQVSPFLLGRKQAYFSGRLLLVSGRVAIIEPPGIFGLYVDVVPFPSAPRHSWNQGCWLRLEKRKSGGVRCCYLLSRC